MNNWVRLKHPDIRQCLKLQVHGQGDTVISSKLKQTGIWEHFETTLLFQNLNSGDCVLDIGANIGYFSLIAGNIVGNKGHVFSFEPEEKNFNLLSSSVEASGMRQIHCLPFALSNESKEAELFLSDDNFGDHQLYSAPGYNDHRTKQIIRMIEGDDFFFKQQAELVLPNFIKMDTQGSEFMILDGLRKVIKQSLPHLKMIIEFWPAGIRRSGYSAYDLLDLLLTFNLPLFIIDHIAHQLIPVSKHELLPWIDALTAEPENDGFMNLFIGQPYEQ